MVRLCCFFGVARVNTPSEEDSDLVCQPGARWMDINETLKEKGIPLFFPVKFLLSYAYVIKTLLTLVSRSIPHLELLLEACLVQGALEVS